VHLSRVTWYRRSWPRTRRRGAGDADHITTVESPTFAGASFGLVGQYERIDGTFAGEVDPKDPSNADIVDIALAPKNAHGKVTYSADFQILRPIDLSKGNHRVIFELPNRGRTNILGILNDSTTPNDTTKSGDPGIGPRSCIIRLQSS
jgi:hypothetical protein